MKTTHRIGEHLNGGALYVEIEIRTQEDRTPELSICGSYPGGGGQCRDDVASVVAFAPGWDAAKRDHLLGIWEAWHLNGMRPNCQHQVGPEWTPKDIEITSYSIDWDARRALQRQHTGYCQGQRVSPDLKTAALQKTVKWSPAAEILLCLEELGIKPFAWVALDRAYLRRRLNQLPLNLRPFIGECPPDDPGHPVILAKRETKSTGWLRESDHPAGYLMKACPTCGYAYGSKWLQEPLPADVVTWIEALQQTGTTQAPETLEADGFLQAHGITFAAQHAQSKAGCLPKAQHWRVTLTQTAPDTAAPLSFDFWASQRDTEQGVSLEASSVLSSLASDIGYDDVDELAQELDLAPSQAIAAVAFGDRLRGFFTESQQHALEALR